MFKLGNFFVKVRSLALLDIVDGYSALIFGLVYIAADDRLHGKRKFHFGIFLVLAAPSFCNLGRIFPTWFCYVLEICIPLPYFFGCFLATIVFSLVKTTLQNRKRRACFFTLLLIAIAPLLLFFFSYLNLNGLLNTTNTRYRLNPFPLSKKMPPSIYNARDNLSLSITDAMSHDILLTDLCLCHDRYPFERQSKPMNKIAEPVSALPIGHLSTPIRVRPYNWTIHRVPYSFELRSYFKRTFLHCIESNAAILIAGRYFWVNYRREFLIFSLLPGVLITLAISAFEIWRHANDSSNFKLDRTCNVLVMSKKIAPWVGLAAAISFIFMITICMYY